MSSLSPTAIAASALALDLPALPPSPADAACGLCGIPLVKGVTPAKAYAPTTSFGAHEHIHPQRSALICAACALATSSASGFMTRYSRALFSPAGAWRLSSAEDVCWMLESAQAPFVAVFNTRSAAHVLWQAPVTYDRKLMGLVLGDRVGTVRPEAVFSARAALARLTEYSNEIVKANYQWPVFNLSLYQDVADVCRLIPSHDRLLRDSADHQVVEDLRLFDDLTQTERWALSAMLLARPKRDQPASNFAEPPRLERTS